MVWAALALATVQPHPCAISALPPIVSADSIQVPVQFNLTKGWHIYWLNPGDSGMATKITVDAPGWQLDSVDWPAPKKFDEDGLITYGYSGAPVAFVNLKPGEGARGQLAKISASWLVCMEQCLQGSGSVEVKISPASRIQAPQEIDRHRKALPQPGLKSIEVEAEEGGIVFTAGLPTLDSIRSAYFFAVDSQSYDHAAEQVYAGLQSQVRLSVPFSQYAEGVPDHLEGVLQVVTDQGKTLSYTVPKTPIKK